MTIIMYHNDDYPSLHLQINEGCRILSNPTVIVLYLVSLLFAQPILHPTDNFLEIELLLFTCYSNSLSTNVKLQNQLR